MDRGVHSLVKNVKARYRNAWYVVELSAALNAVRKLSESERKNVRSTGYYFFLSKNGNQILEHVNLSVGPEERLWDSCTERLWQDHTVKRSSAVISARMRAEPCRRRAASTERLLSGTDDLSASGTGSQFTTSHARGAKRRRWHLKRADRRTWDRRRLEKPVSAGTFRGELQRFCIARALGKGTKYLLCDEITTMLDFITQGQIWNFFNRGNEKDAGSEW